MIPVTQESMTSDVQAYRAALASILEVDLDVLPAFEGMAGPMQWDAWMATELNLCLLRFAVDTMERPPGMWLALIMSPYVGYEMHTVVMRGGALAHDPHPEPQEYRVLDLLAVIEMMLPLDPALPSGRHAL